MFTLNFAPEDGLDIERKLALDEARMGLQRVVFLSEEARNALALNEVLTLNDLRRFRPGAGFREALLEVG